MNYLYSDLGIIPRTDPVEQAMRAAAAATGLSPEEFEKRLKQILRAQKRGALRVEAGPFKKLVVGYWKVVDRAPKIKWLASKLNRSTMVSEVAQRAGILPLKVVSIPASEGSPAMSFAMFAKWEKPITGQGTVKVGLFPWESTDLFKKKEAKYDIPATTEEQKFFIEEAVKRKSWSPPVDVYKFGKGKGKQVVLGGLSKYPIPSDKNNLKIVRKPESAMFSLGDLIAIATLPVVAMNVAILKAVMELGLIDAFGAIIGAILDVAAAAMGVITPFVPGFQMAPESQYRAPNYLLWGGVAAGIVGVAAIMKRRQG